MTKLEEQDAFYQSIGFHPDSENDYELPHISDDEWKKMRNVEEYLLNLPKSERLFRISDSHWDLIDFYSYCQENFKSFVDSIRGKVTFDLPNEEIFSKFDKHAKYHWVKEFIIKDGGEIREGKAFEVDGDTERPNWVRFYWK